MNTKVILKMALTDALFLTTVFSGISALVLLLILWAQHQQGTRSQEREEKAAQLVLEVKQALTASNEKAAQLVDNVKEALTKSNDQQAHLVKEVKDTLQDSKPRKRNP